MEIAPPSQATEHSQQSPHNTALHLSRPPSHPTPEEIETFVQENHLTSAGAIRREIDRLTAEAITFFAEHCPSGRLGQRENISALITQMEKEHQTLFSSIVHTRNLCAITLLARHKIPSRSGDVVTVTDERRESAVRDEAMETSELQRMSALRGHAIAEFLIGESTKAQIIWGMQYSKGLIFRTASEQLVSTMSEAIE